VIIKSVAQVQQAYGIKYREENFINGGRGEVAPAFIAELSFTLENLDAFSSEAARCELIMLPLLREVYKSYAASLSLWVQKAIAYNEALSGTPDYLVSRRSPLGKTVLEYPLLLVVEAKKNDFEQSWGQCLAELVAAQNLNQDWVTPVYGVVTDSKYWEFGNLAEDIFTKNRVGFSVDDVAELCGALDFVFAAAGRQTAASLG
jgi:hypothetical protein